MTLTVGSCFSGIGGMYTPEELGANVDVVDGDVVIVESKQERPSLPNIDMQSISAPATETFVTINADEPEARSIVDVLTDEIDAPAVDEIEQTEVIQALRDVADRRDLRGIRDRMTAAGLWDDPQTSDAFQIAYDRLTGAQTKPAKSNAAQPALVDA